MRCRAGGCCPADGGSGTGGNATTDGSAGSGAGDQEPAPGCTADSPICCGTECITTDEAAVRLCAQDSNCTGSSNVTEGAGSDSPPPCICTRELRPMCGKDGRDYNNPCLAECAGTSVAYEGTCCCGDGEFCCGGQCLADGTEKAEPCTKPACCDANSAGSGGSEGPKPVPGCTAEKPICCGTECITTEQAAVTLCIPESDCSGAGGGGGPEPMPAELPGAGGNGSEGCFCIALYDPVCGVDGKVWLQHCAASD